MGYNWTQADRDLLVRLDTQHATDSLEHLTDIFNAEAEYGGRTQTSLAWIIRRLGAKPTRPWGPRVERAPSPGPSTIILGSRSSARLQASYNQVAHDAPGESGGGGADAQSSGEEDQPSDDEAIQIRAPLPSIHQTRSATAAGKRPAPASFASSHRPISTRSANSTNSTVDLAAEASLIGSLEDYLKYSAMLIDIKRRRVG